MFGLSQAVTGYAMEEGSGKLTVYFDEPFWVGVFERIGDGMLSVCKVTFGAEPKDYEVWEFVLCHYYALKYSPAVKVEQKQSADNPKRRQRGVKKQLLKMGIGTKSQKALAAQREERKFERKNSSREQRDAKWQHRLEIKQKKRKEKHKGH